MSHLFIMHYVVLMALAVKYVISLSTTANSRSAVSGATSVLHGMFFVISHAHTSGRLVGGQQAPAAGVYRRHPGAAARGAAGEAAGRRPEEESHAGARPRPTY